MLKTNLFILSLVTSFKIFANDEVCCEIVSQAPSYSYQNKKEKPIYKPLNPANAAKLRAPGTKVYAAAENAYLIENHFRDKNHPGYKYAITQRFKADNIYKEVDKAYQVYLIADDLYRKTVPKEYHMAAHRAFLISDESHERFLQKNNPVYAKLRRAALKLRAEYYQIESMAVAADDYADDAFNSIEE